MPDEKGMFSSGKNDTKERNKGSETTVLGENFISMKREQSALLLKKKGGRVNLHTC